jgi:hypothetical protein
MAMNPALALLSDKARAGFIASKLLVQRPSLTSLLLLFLELIVVLPRDLFWLVFRSKRLELEQHRYTHTYTHTHFCVGQGRAACGSARCN